ncbi:hypothetical protein SUGI_0695050 [Cryptomeria japonica]|nr:hypothetical protein SUGI_0695050 [Cryptomeria japonica]
MMECPDFYQDRIKFGLAKKYICLLLSDRTSSKYNARISIYDPVDQSCKLLSRIPTNANTTVYKIINVNHKILVLAFERLAFGRYYATPIFLIYDLLSSTWKYGAKFPSFKPDIKGFACCASPDGSIYIAGARDREAAVYKVDEDKWVLLPEMHQEMGSCRGVFIEGMFYVIGFGNNGCQRFDPSTRVWTTIINMSMPHSCSIVLYAFGQLIAYGGGGIKQYDWEGNVWRELDTKKPFHATMWCDRIFFCTSICTPGHLKFYIYEPGTASSERLISFDDEEMRFESIATIEI